MTPSELEQVRWELYSLLRRLCDDPRDADAIESVVRIVHAADLKKMEDTGAYLMWKAIHARNIDIVVVMMEAGAEPDEGAIDLYYCMLRSGDIIYDLNGDELDDAGIARRVRVLHDVHGVRLTGWNGLSGVMLFCVEYDRLECVRTLIEVDPHARGYTADTHDSLLHFVAMCHMPHMVQLLLQNGWRIDSHDLNLDGLSPLGACLMSSYIPSLEAALSTLDALLHDVDDAASALRSSGLCEVPHRVNDAGEKKTILQVPHASLVCILKHVCAAVNARINLQRCMLSSARRLRTVTMLLDGPSASILCSLPLDVHVHTGIGDPIYLRDSLRVTSSYDSATRYAVGVDALCAEATRSCRDPLIWMICTYSHNMLRKGGATTAAGVSPTLQHWAWMRRLHAILARSQMLQREAGRRYTVARGGNVAT